MDGEGGPTKWGPEKEEERESLVGQRNGDGRMYVLVFNW